MSNTLKKQALFLMGPTAAGKTALALSLAQQIPIQIISVDSSMIYQDMDIGTGKPSSVEQATAPHKLIDIISPQQTYSVGNFCSDAINAMEQAILENKLPVLVGGTMMYFKALQFGLSPLPQADYKLRQGLLEEASKNGWEYMHNKLQELDPVSAKRIHQNDLQRIQRALEVNIITGKPMENNFAVCESALQGWNIITIAIVPESRTLLHDNIEKRFYTMIELGFIKEVEGLIKKYNLGSSLDLPAMRSVGYRQIINYLNGDTTYAEMIEKSLAATRQLAKRQYTWLRSWDNLEWLDVNSSNLTSRIISMIKMYF